MYGGGNYDHVDCFIRKEWTEMEGKWEGTIHKPETATTAIACFLPFPAKSCTRLPRSINTFHTDRQSRLEVGRIRIRCVHTDRLFWINMQVETTFGGGFDQSPTFYKQTGIPKAMTY